MAATTFTHKIERLKLSILEGEDLTGFRKPVRSGLVASIAEDVGRLPGYVFENPRSAELARLCLTPQLRAATAGQAYGLKVGSLLEFLRQLLELDGLPDYGDIVQRQFSDYIAAHPFNADQIRFLRAVQNIFIRRRRLERADLYDPPLTAFGQERGGAVVCAGAGNGDVGVCGKTRGIDRHRPDRFSKTCQVWR